MTSTAHPATADTCCAPFRRPLTDRERLAVRINLAAHEALRCWRMPTEIRGFVRHPCPGRDAFHRPCHAPSAWSGSFACVHFYHLTNHPHDDRS